MPFFSFKTQIPSILHKTCSSRGNNFKAQFVSFVASLQSAVLQIQAEWFRFWLDLQLTRITDFCPRKYYQRLCVKNQHCCVKILFCLSGSIALFEVVFALDQSQIKSAHGHQDKQLDSGMVGAHLHISF